MVVGGVSTVIWDVWLLQKIGKLRAKWARKKRGNDEERSTEENGHTGSIPLEEQSRDRPVEGVQRRAQASASKDRISTEQTEPASTSSIGEAGRDGRQRTDTAPTVADTTTHGIPVKLGICIIAGFFGMQLP